MAWTLETLKKNPSSLTTQLLTTVVNVNKTGSGAPLHIQGQNYPVDLYGISGDARSATATLNDGSPVSVTIRCDGAVGGVRNAYALPWAQNTVCITRLGQSFDLFFTSAMNSCAVFISGPQTSPVIVHANTMHAEGGDNLQANLRGYQTIYGAMATKLTEARYLEDDNKTKILWPGMANDSYLGRAGVFGVKNGMFWSIYVVIQNANVSRNVKIFP